MLPRRDKWLLLALLVLGAGCGPPPDDDDTAVVTDDDDATGDDDDTTPPPDPLADVIGVFNLINVVQAPGVSYVDLSGAFGTFAVAPDDVLSPGAYLATFSYGADAPYWRIDLGAYPLPPLGGAETVDMVSWYPWSPGEQTWWDGGARIGVGNYLTSRLDFDDVQAYMVDDPVSPGAAGWTAGGTLSWASEGGDPVIDWAGEVRLPEAVELIDPAPFSTLEHPAALDLLVRWTPGSDGSFVTVGIINAMGMAYTAHVPDNGEYTVPGEVLRQDFGGGSAELVVARNLQTPLDHPQGNILMRTREERRVALELLPDVVLDPAWGEPGESLAVTLSWFTEDLSGGVDVDLGEGVLIGQVVPDPSDEHTVQLQVNIEALAEAGPRDLTLQVPGGDELVLGAAFAVLNLAPSDSCATADAASVLEPGSYSSTTAGLSNDFASGYACLAWSLNGADAVYRVELEPGEQLVATLDMPSPGDGAMALLSACGDLASAVACADGGVEGDSETLVHTSAAGGLHYLVVDSWTSGSYGAFSAAWQLELSIERDVLDPDWIVPGESRSFVLSGEVPWDAGLIPSDLNLGAGLGVEAMGVGSVPTDLEFLAAANSGAAPGPRDIVVDNGATGEVSFPEALWVTGWPPHDTCSEAVSAPAVTPGTTTGYAPGTTSVLDDVTCMPYPSLGPEVILPLQLSAGALVDVTVTLPDEDAQLYILSACDPTACFDDAVADDTFLGEEEAITEWVAPAEGRYYVVVDIYGGLENPLTPWQFDLSISVE